MTKRETYCRFFTAENDAIRYHSSRRSLGTHGKRQARYSRLHPFQTARHADTLQTLYLLKKPYETFWKLGVNRDRSFFHPRLSIGLNLRSQGAVAWSLAEKIEWAEGAILITNHPTTNIARCFQCANTSGWASGHSTNFFLASFDNHSLQSSVNFSCVGKFSVSRYCG